MDKSNYEMTVNEIDRHMKEQMSAFADPKYSHRASQVQMTKTLFSPMKRPDALYEKKWTRDDNGKQHAEESETNESIIRRSCWDDLFERLGRWPSKWELIAECQALLATTNASSFGTIAAHAGFKPVDMTLQTTVNVNPYSDFSDEELQMIRMRREQKSKEVEHDNTNTEK